MFVPVEAIIVPFVFGIPAAVAITKMWFNHKEKMAGLGGPKEGTAILDARLARVEQAVESIAIEMERVSEGQRFVTKILSERPQSPGQLSPGQLPPGQQGSTPR